MDLSIPHTFYPTALPGWIAWVLFLFAMLIGASIALVRGRSRGWFSGVFAGAIGVQAMFVAFFVILIFLLMGGLFTPWTRCPTGPRPWQRPTR
jgi:hypothetical protein